MTKRFAGLALAGAAAVTFVLPATPASACSWTFPQQCVEDILASAVSEVCVPFGTFTYCV